MTTAPISEDADQGVPQTIVVPLDGSPFAERAVPVARTIARRIGARLMLVTTGWGDWESGDRKAYLEAIARQHADVPTEVTLIDEHPAALAIEHVVNAATGRLVCMTSHGRGGFRWALLGSVAEQVVRDTHKPMLLAGGHCRVDWPGEFRHMLVCVDASNVADPIIPVATRWAKALRLDIRVALVIHPLDVQGATHPDETVGAIVQRFVADGLDAAPVILRSSHIAGAIADFAGTLPATLIAMNTHARGGIARMTLGSVAMATVGLADCPVLLAPGPR